MPYCQMKTAGMPVPVVATKGVELVLADGRRLIDAMASWWCACHGYNHPHIVAAMSEQLDQMPHVMMGGIQHEPAMRLATRLAKILPGNLNRVFFSDSGSVAVEVAMKMAIQYHRQTGSAGRTRFVAFQNAYHGDTTGAMSLCDPHRSMHASFDGGLLSQIHLPLPVDEASRSDLHACLSKHADSIAGVFIEPLLQGAGGMRFHSPSVLTFLRQVCDRHSVLLIVDELATGFGRTGTMFAVEQANVTPDIICLGKSMTGGAVGMAATVATERVFDAFWSDDVGDALMHGPTFMGNPLACAAANASLDLFESEPRMDDVHRIETQLIHELSPAADIPGVVDVRCLGATGVIQVDELHDLDRLRSAFVDRGVWIRPFGDVIYTTPAYTITPDQLSTVKTTMLDVVQQWSAW